MLKEKFVMHRKRADVGYFTAHYNGYALLQKRFTRKYGCKINKLVYSVYKNKVGVFYTEKNFKKYSNFIKKKALKTRNFVLKQRKEIDKRGKRLIKFCDRNHNLSKLSNKKLIKVHFGYIKHYTDMCFIGSPLQWTNIGAAIEKILSKKIKDYKTLAFLSLPTEPSWLQREKIDLLRVKLGKKSLKDHIKEYGSFPFGYIGPKLWDRKYFLKKLKKIKEPEKDLQKELGYFKDLERKQKKIVSKRSYKFCKDLQMAFMMQDKKKEYQTRAHPFFQLRLLKEESKRTGIPVNYLRYMCEYEVRDALLGRKFDLKELKKRSEKSVMIAEDGKYTFLTEESAEPYVQEFYLKKINKKELKGVCASRGKVKGKARVFKSANDRKKFNKGDILIAPMTTPDYVPYMKKAGAIVTDEGGITCHAAIVSRELRIPCVIGTEVATKVLKDGDVIEVDADNGLVKKLDHS